MADLNREIRLQQKIVYKTFKNNDEQVKEVLNLGTLFYRRFSQLATMADLEKAISISRQVIDLTSESHTKWPDYLTSLSFRLGDRYSMTGMSHDLDEAIQIGREAIELTPEDFPGKARRLSNLGALLHDQFESVGDAANLEEAIQIGSKAVDLTPEGDPDRVVFLSNLGALLRSQYARSGLLSDLEEAIRVGQEAITTAEDDYPDMETLLSNVATQFGDKYFSTGDLTDLGEAIRMGREAIDKTPQDSPDRGRYLNTLAIQLHRKFLRLGTTEDLENAIQLCQEALQILELTPHKRQDKAACLSNLGSQLGDKYSTTEDVTILEEAIHFGREAVSITPEDDPYRAVWLGNLAILLGKRIGVMADLEEAIELGRHVVEHTSTNFPERARYLNTLSVQLHLRFSRKGEYPDLEEAIRLGRASIDLTPENHPERAPHLSNLALCLQARHMAIRQGDDPDAPRQTGDIREAISFAKQAVDATPEGHPRRADYLNNVSVCFRANYGETRSKETLDEAIFFGREAVKAAPDGTAFRATWLMNVAALLRDRFMLHKTERTGMEEALLYNESVLHQSTSPIASRLMAGREILDCSAIISEWQRGYDAAAVAVKLIPKLISRSSDNPDKHFLLGHVFFLASDTAAVALRLQKEPLVALQILEQGRGVLAASLEEMRTDVLDLQRSYPELARQFDNLRSELTQPVMRSTTLSDAFQQAGELQQNRQYRANEELDRLIVEIREQPGFEDFLQAPSKTDIEAAAKDGAIVVVNASKHGCDAILIQPQKIWSLALPRLKTKDIYEKADKNDWGSLETLAWLWDVAMEPILDALGFTQLPLNPSEDNWPHIWWVPTGRLAEFPLHAAGHHNAGSSETVLDRVMSSYSSSVKALVHSRRRPAITSTSSALLVAMEKTRGYSWLPHAAAEIKVVRGLCESMALSPIKPKRRKQEMISHLMECKIFHFAGHGYTDATDPSQSHLLLEDSEELSVGTLLEVNLRERSPFLAYLSACGTGQIKDTSYLDESTHLIGGYQLAGFRHVIGTLWEVDDKLCVDMARITYEAIGEGRMTDKSVCWGLHKATRELRSRWMENTGTVRRRSRRVRKMRIIMGQTKTGAPHGRQRDVRLPRDVILCDDNGEEAMTSPPWVPYVHFGV
ncbi:CHAT domain-containing protein [Dactylonectria estremocensis]|uniref:CHAT domain-containing protein n=1 Tax=Dactylonectria estremocensis TaxID=1079267 RepID=A0A9P9JHS9_9HYPO|nr:CHAT domain-containing protein [Dactylonectria estremocensis]